MKVAQVVWSLFVVLSLCGTVQAEGGGVPVSGTVFSVTSADGSVQEGNVQVRLGFPEGERNIVGAIVGKTDPSFLTDHDVETHAGKICTNDDAFTSDFRPVGSDQCLLTFEQDIHVVPVVMPRHTVPYVVQPGYSPT